MDELEQTHYKSELLRLLARGEREIEDGKGRDLDAVFIDADALLEQMRSCGVEGPTSRAPENG